MSYKFPSPEWVVEFDKQINTSDAYANAAQTWAGRGQQPNWLAAEIAKGRSLADFAIG